MVGKVCTIFLGRRCPSKGLQNCSCRPMMDQPSVSSSDFKATLGMRLISFWEWGPLNLPSYSFCSFVGRIWSFCELKGKSWASSFDWVFKFCFVAWFGDFLFCCLVFFIFPYSISLAPLGAFLFCFWVYLYSFCNPAHFMSKKRKLTTYLKKKKKTLSVVPSPYGIFNFSLP